MSLKEQIDRAIKQAMLSRNKEELEALRGIKSLILLAETEKGSTGPLSLESEQKLLMKAAKQRKESAAIFGQEHRADLAERELFQLEVIQRYLPQPLSGADLEKEVARIIREAGAQGPKDMGRVMGAATRELAGRAEGKAIADLVKKMLST